MNALAPPASRLIEAARRLTAGTAAETRRSAGEAAGESPGARIVGPRADGGDPSVLLDGTAAAERTIVLGWIGTHRDARDSTLRRLWDLEEAARATGADVLVLRLAPLVGPASPLMAWLARRPRLDARLARSLVQPVLESDVVATLAHALAGGGPRRGWFELCGPDPLAVGELAAVAAAAGPREYAASPACEPSESILRGQGLAEWEPWALAFGVTPRPICDPARRGPA